MRTARHRSRYMVHMKQLLRPCGTALVHRRQCFCSPVGNRTLLLPVRVFVGLAQRSSPYLDQVCDQEFRKESYIFSNFCTIIPAAFLHQFRRELLLPQRLRVPPVTLS